MTSSLAERQLILLSAGIMARRQALGEQAGELAVQVDWSRLSLTLHRRRLLSTLGPRVIELVDGRASDDFVARVEQATNSGRRYGAFLQLVAERVIGALADSGIASAPLKGPLLSEAVYGDLGRRLSGDIDLLVAPERLHEAVGVVRELGYGTPTNRTDGDGLPLLHFALFHERGELPPVELHWRVHWYERDFSRERLLPSVGALPAWRPEPADELAAMLLFYARDGFVDLRLATDLSAWWDTFGEKLHAGVFMSLLEDYPALDRVLLTSLAVAQRVVGLPAARIVGHATDLRLRQRMAMRLANPNPWASPSQLHAEMGLIDGLLMPSWDFGAFVKRQLLLPPRDLLDMRTRGKRREKAWERQTHGQRIGSSLKKIGSSLDYGMRVMVRSGVLLRYGLAVTRLLRTPETVC